MYKIVTFGNTKEVSLGEISLNLYPSSEVYSISDGEIYLGLISHKTLVLFCVEFADYALQNYEKKKFPKTEECLFLVRKWIETPNSVSKEELEAPANAANAAASAAYAASNAASNAAYAAAYSANSAFNAANAAGKDREKEFERQGRFILDFLKSGNHLFLA
jgi:hypothetical protein